MNKGSDRSLPPVRGIKPLMNLGTPRCPHCLANLIAQEVPEEKRHLHLVSTQQERRRPSGNRPFLFYTHLLAIASTDGSPMAWECPFCHEIDVVPGMEFEWYAHVSERAKAQAKQESAWQYDVVVSNGRRIAQEVDLAA